MQVDAPHHPPSSIREFLRQYAMIVLSILTALALEQMAVAWHEATNARASKARIEAELATNLADLETSEQQNDVTTRQVKQSLRDIVALLKAGVTDQDKILAAAKPALDHFDISFPTWRRNAWDGAIADQSAGHLAAQDLQRFAEIYSGAVDDATSAQLLLSGDWLSLGAERRLDMALGKIAARPLADSMARFLLAAEQITANQKNLADLIKRGQSVPAAAPK